MSFPTAYWPSPKLAAGLTVVVAGADVDAVACCLTIEVTTTVLVVVCPVVLSPLALAAPKPIPITKAATGTQRRRYHGGFVVGCGGVGGVDPEPGAVDVNGLSQLGRLAAGYSRACTKACVPLVRQDVPVASSADTVSASRPTSTSDLRVR